MDLLGGENFIAKFFASGNGFVNFLAYNGLHGEPSVEWQSPYPEFSENGLSLHRKIAEK